MNIITNNVPRVVLTWHELTPKEQAEFDYFDPSHDSGSFVRYKGVTYDLDDGFEYSARIGWYCQADTYFSCILFRWTPDDNFETVIMGRYYE